MITHQTSICMLFFNMKTDDKEKQVFNIILQGILEKMPK